MIGRLLCIYGAWYIVKGFVFFLVQNGLLAPFFLFFRASAFSNS